MCIIVDANRLGDFLADPAKPDAAPVRKWLDRGAGRIVYSTGGAFAREIGRRHRVRLQSWVQAGRASVIPASRFADDERRLGVLGSLRSDDPHVLALAREADVRLLYTNDPDLIADFKNKQIIDRPRGKVYSSAANAGLLDRAVCGQVMD